MIRFRSTSLAWVVGILAVLTALPTSTRALRTHLADLWHHTRSGSWETAPSERSITRLLGSKYSGTDWRVHSISGSWQRFPLQLETRRETLQVIGGAILDETELLRFKAQRLPSAYAGLLADAVTALALPEATTGHRVLDHLVTELRGPVLPTGEDLEILLTQANVILAEMPATATLRRALVRWNDWRGELDNAWAFEVFSRPSWDLDGAWSEQAVTLEQEGKCRAAVVPLEGEDPEGSIAVFASVAPRVAKIELERAWLSNELLDDLARSSQPLLRHHFASRNGPLHLIPSHLWIRLGDRVTLSPVDGASRAQMESWIAAGSCCRTRCEGSEAVFPLVPSTVVATSDDGSFVGHRGDEDPLLVAVVSRRRTAEG